MDSKERQLYGFDAGVRRTAFRFGFLYWVAVFVFSSILWGAARTDPIETTFDKLAHYAVCSLVSLGIAAILAHQHFRARTGRRQRSLAVQALLCFVLALFAAPVYSLTDFVIYAWKVWPYPAVFDWKEAGYNLVYGAALFFGWSCLFLTLLYSFDVRDRERRLAVVREEALAAQMRALRYQVNPHFLFNTLNSVACMIEEGDAARVRKDQTVLTSPMQPATSAVATRRRAGKPKPRRS